MNSIKPPGGYSWLSYVCVFSCLAVIFAFVTGHIPLDTAKSAVQMLVDVTKLLMLVSLE
jgi:hypothetical protein